MTDGSDAFVGPGCSAHATALGLIVAIILLVVIIAGAPS